MRIDFHASERCSLGIEWELGLVDLETRELASAASEVLGELRPEGTLDHPKAKHELFESTIEVITGICSTVAEAQDDLAGTVALVAERAAARGLGLMCSGTHPITDWRTQTVTASPRYAKLVEDNQWLARRLLIFGVHVHVGVRSADKAIPIVNALSAYIPHFLALSASSPYWAGSDTGLASARCKVFEGLHTAGLPVALSDWAEFERYMATLISTRSIETVREVWWDIRPHPMFGTVELRMCDGLSTLEEIGAVAALAQCLVERFDGELDRGVTLTTPRPWVVRENKWRAARTGLDAQIIIGDDSKVVPVSAAIGDLVGELALIAERLECSAELESVKRILDRGASYQRQRAVAARRGGDLAAVVDSLVGEMRDGLTRHR